MGGDYYEILGLKRGASIGEIKKSYRHLVMLYHPDKNQSPEAVVQFNLIQTAYDTLSDTNLKQQYDAALDRLIVYHEQIIAKPQPESHQEVPINPVTGKKNYKYYRTNNYSKNSTSSPRERRTTNIVLDQRARYYSSRFWFLLVVSYTLSFFVVLPIGSSYFPNKLGLSDLFFSIPLGLFCLTSLIDSYAVSNTRTAIILSSHDYVRSFEAGMRLNMGRMVKFFVFQVPDLNTDQFTNNNSRAETIPFTKDFEPVIQQKFKFHYTPLLRFCFKITLYENQDKEIHPDFRMAGNLHIYRALLVIVVLLNLFLHSIPEGLGNFIVFVSLVALMCLKNQSLTS